jgi:hypothetical protein
MECPLQKKYKIPLSSTTNGNKIPHLKQCTASVNKAPTSFCMASTITHLTVPLTRQKCYRKCEGKI